MGSKKIPAKSKMSNTDQKISQLEELNKQAEQGGGEARVKNQHERGKLTARERIDLLLDPGSFQEIGKFVFCKPLKINFTPG